MAYDKVYNDIWGDAYVRGSYNGLLGRKFYYPSSSSYPKSLRRSFWFLSSDTPYGAGRNAGYIDGNYFGYLQDYKYGENRRNNLIKAGGYVPGDERTQTTPYDPISPLLPKWFEGLGW